MQQFMRWASAMISWLGRPLMSQMNPTPQESCSFAGVVRLLALGQAEAELFCQGPLHLLIPRSGQLGGPIVRPRVISQRAGGRGRYATARAFDDAHPVPGSPTRYRPGVLDFVGASHTARDGGQHSAGGFPGADTPEEWAAENRGCHATGPANLAIGTDKST